MICPVNCVNAPHEEVGGGNEEQKRGGGSAMEKASFINSQGTADGHCGTKRAHGACGERSVTGT